MSRKGALARLAVGSVALVLLLHSAFAADRPLIGIYTQDSPSSYSRIPGSDAEYIAASYAKLVESAGARPVPVSYNLGEEDLVNTLESLDGFVFPGGGMDLSLNKTYAKSAQVVLEYAVKSGRDDFPVVGICLGFQLISTVVSQSNGVLSDSVSAARYFPSSTACHPSPPFPSTASSPLHPIIHIFRLLLSSSCIGPLFLLFCDL